jgi:hypothetical protein
LNINIIRTFNLLTINFDFINTNNLHKYKTSFFNKIISRLNNLKYNIFNYLALYKFGHKQSKFMDPELYNKSQFNKFNPNNKFNKFNPNNQTNKFNPNNQTNKFNPNNQTNKFNPNNQTNKFNPNNKFNKFNSNNKFNKFNKNKDDDMQKIKKPLKFLGQNYTSVSLSPKQVEKLKKNGGLIVIKRGKVRNV